MKRIRVGIVGCGGYSSVHARRMRAAEGVRIVAICDIDPERMDRYMARPLEGYRPAPKRYRSIQAMLKAGGLDAVVIATPHTLHYDQAMRALRAGCHVLLEKPMVTDAQDAARLARKVKQTGKVLVVSYNPTFTPALQHVRQAIRRGSLGRLELVSGFIAQDWKRLTAGSWRQQPELSGGGQAYDSGAHLLASLCWAIESAPAEVAAFVDNQETPVDINATINVRFKNNVMAAIAVGGNCPATGARLSYLFEKGRIDVDAWFGLWIHEYRGGAENVYIELPAAPGTPDTNFLQAIRGEAEPMCSAVDGLNQSQLMAAVYESARKGRLVKLPVK